jgi:hypothetical protein
MLGVSYYDDTHAVIGVYALIWRYPRKVKMETVIHFLTEPDHLMFLAATVTMLLGKTDRRWLAVFFVAGLTWVVASHLILG